MNHPRAALIFDFDGTVALGSGPVVAYARSVSEAMGGWDGAADVEAAAERPWTVRGPGGEAARDGYDAVRLAALAHGATGEILQGAYLASRELLGTLAAPVAPPEGLATLLDNAAPVAWRILATNAPATRLRDALAFMGLAGAFDEIRPSLGKPTGLAALVAEKLSVGPVLCVGDIWELDLEPATALGATTALICPPAMVPEGAAPDFVGETFADVSSGIEGWLASLDAPTTTTEQ